MTHPYKMSHFTILNNAATVLYPSKKQLNSATQVMLLVMDLSDRKLSVEIAIVLSFVCCRVLVVSPYTACVR